MKLLSVVVFILVYTYLLSSCTLRRYEINFHYYVGNNGYSENLTESDIELMKKTAENLEKQLIAIPPGSGNLTIYVQAEVPKHIQTDADAEF